jgi:O-antigen/teichoic acid export membrane protein
MLKEQIHGAVLARNTAFNLLGSVVPVGVALVVTPYVIRGLGVERFGVLSLVWAILWYASYFDLGLARATTKFASEALGKGQSETIPTILRASLRIQVLLGGIAALCVYLVTPLLLGRVLHIPAALSRESQLAFYGIGITIPFFLAAGILSALLAGAHRFDLVNLVKIPANSLMFLLPALGIYFNYRLPGVVMLLFLSRVLVSAVLLRLCWKVFPKLASRPASDINITTPLLKFGGWVTVSNFLAPLIIYLDRFVVGSVLSLAAITFYSVPSEMVSRLQFIPGSIGGVLFPAFSLVHLQDSNRLTRLYARSLKITLLMVGPVAVLLYAFASDILRLWLGSEFSKHSSLTLQLLSVGLLLTSVGQIPGNLLDGIGRPDLRAKIYLAYFLPFLGILWILVQKRGIEGAAVAWSVRAGGELVLYVVVTARHLHLRVRAHFQSGLLKATCACTGLAGMVFLIRALASSDLLIRVISSAVAIGVFLFVIWRFVLDPMERHTLHSAVGYSEEIKTSVE